jgi:hypothetical protein
MSLQISQTTTSERLLLPYRATLLAIAFVTTSLAACTTIPATQTNAQQPAKLDSLGTVDFPTSCSENAQAHVLRGVAALHSLWYSVAIDEFRESTRIDPGCMMGYWGEAMAHDHPIWGDPQETEAARQVLTKIRITPELTARERAYLNAVKALAELHLSATGSLQGC